MVSNEMQQHLEGLPHTVNQYFPSGQCIMLQSDAWREDPSKVQDRKIGFNITENEKFIDIIPYSTVKLTFEDTAPFMFGVVHKQNSHSYLKRPLETSSFSTTFLCEARCFSYTSENQIRKKQLSTSKPDVKEVCKNAQQCHSSHRVFLGRYRFYFTLSK